MNPSGVAERVSYFLVALYVASAALWLIEAATQRDDRIAHIVLGCGFGLLAAAWVALIRVMRSKRRKRAAAHADVLA
jgi:hypothetical protein